MILQLVKRSLGVKDIAAMFVHLPLFDSLASNTSSMLMTTDLVILWRWKSTYLFMHAGVYRFPPLY